MKRIVAVLAFVFLLSFVVSPLNATETRIIWDLDSLGINVKIWAPWQAYPNDTMTIEIKVLAGEDLQDVNVRFKIYGSMSDGSILWLRPLDALKNVDLSSGVIEDQYFDVDIPESVDPGLLHGYVDCSWKVWRNSSWQERSIDDACVHRVTYLRNKPYEDLQVAYDQLLADYTALLNSYNALQTSYYNLEDSHSILWDNYSVLLTNYDELLANYSSLQNDYNNLLSNYSSLQASVNELKSKYEFGGEIASALNLMYVFIETTVIFIATTIYYARSQIYSALRKLKPEQRKAVDVNHSKKQQT